MTTRTKRARRQEWDEYAGYGWAWLSLICGLLVVAMLFGPGEWNFARLIGITATATAGYYTFKLYDRAQHRKGRHTV